MIEPNEKWWNEKPYHSIDAGAEFYDTYDIPAIIAEARRRTLDEVKEMMEAEHGRDGDHPWCERGEPCHILSRLTELQEKKEPPRKD